MTSKHTADLSLTTTRFVVDYDQGARFEECDGGPMPMTAERYIGNEYQKNGQPVSYADYLTYYGNPDRHVVLYVRRQDKCQCCNSWVSGDAAYGIDVMDDDTEADAIGTFTIDQLPGYLKEVAYDLDGPVIHNQTS